MNHLKIRTEYSYKKAFGRVSKVLDRIEELGGEFAGICDLNSTWGHVVWQKACKKRNIKPIFGVELGVVVDARTKEKQPPNYMSFIAKNNDGLRQIYELTTKSTENFYWIPRIDYSDIASLTDDVFIFVGNCPNYDLIKEYDLETRGNVFLNLMPSTPKPTLIKCDDLGIPVAAMGDNVFVTPNDRGAYDITMQRNKYNRTTPSHIISEGEWWYYNKRNDALSNTESIAEQCNVTLPKAKMVEFHCDKSLRQICEENAPIKNVDLSDPIYKARFDRELKLIKDKNFEDYFYVIWDMLVYAKQVMLVGPARGSSCGSLVCYLLNITEIDPIPYGLIFERFIDVNRSDMPDIDIDFPQHKRDLVFDYVKEKYGEENVARLGSVNKLKAKSAIALAAKEMDIKPWDIKDFKDNILATAAGDERAELSIMDTFDTTEVGQKTLKRFPELRVAEQIEAHASHAGQHAAGILITSKPVSNYCTMDVRTGATQIDKRDAETLDLLKIDALGLITLSTIEDCLDQLGWEYSKIFSIPTDDKRTYDLIGQRKYAGIFQFEGKALQNVADSMTTDKFNDIAAITSLARPGPLGSGGAQMYIDRKNGDEPVSYEHPIMKTILGETYGILVYQEQAMMIVREIGGLSWGDTSAIRKAMSKSLGSEFFDKYQKAFVDGAKKLHDIDEKTATKIFDDMRAFGSYGFNKSHAVAYALVSYWCFYLKAHHPLQWAVACLRNSGDGDAKEQRSIKLLRELDKEGIKYKPFDKDKSLEDWSFNGDIVLGGLTNIKGVGVKVAKDIIRRRKAEEKLTDRQNKLLNEGKTPYDMLYEGQEMFSDILENPRDHNIESRLFMLDEIPESAEGDFMIMARIMNKTLRDENEPVNIEKRLKRAEEKGEDIGDGRIEGQTMYLNMLVEDDTEHSIYVRINRTDYPKIGAKIVDEHKEGDWFLFKGRKIKGISMLFTERCRFLGNRKIGYIRDKK